MSSPANSVHSIETAKKVNNQRQGLLSGGDKTRRDRSKSPPDQVDSTKLDRDIMSLMGSEFDYGSSEHPSKHDGEHEDNDSDKEDSQANQSLHSEHIQDAEQVSPHKRQGVINHVTTQADFESVKKQKNQFNSIIWLAENVG